MFKPKRRWKKQRDRWHMRLLRRLYLSKKFCSICESYRDDNPQPREVEQFVYRSSAALVYETRRFGKRNFTVRIGRWQAMSKGLVLSDFHEGSELDDVLEVLSSAQEFVRHRSSSRTS